MSPIADFKYHNKSNLRILYEIFFNTNSSALFIFRLANWFYRHKLRVVSHLLTNLNTTLNGCQISYKADIGKGFKIFHSVGIVLGEITAGEGFSVYQNTTAGMNHKVAENGQKFPVFGDNVTLYSGAIVGGPVKIGNGVRVGANVSVFKDVPENTTVVNAMPTYLNKRTNLTHK